MVVIISVNAREHFGVVRSYANFKLSYSSSVMFTPKMRGTIKSNMASPEYVNYPAT